MSNYKNPFATFNTNGMPSEQLSELFTDPFKSINKTRQDVISDTSSIIFVGSRGTGKTMLLRQFSYNVQKIALNVYPTFLDKINAEKYIGVYFRLDKAHLKSLDTLSDYVTDLKSFSDNVFIHFFELTIFKDILEIVKILLNDKKLASLDDTYKKIISKLVSLFNLEKAPDFSDIDEIITYVVTQINYVWRFQSQKAIDINGTVKFEPDCNLILQGRLTDEFLIKYIFEDLGLNDVNVLVLIDEFENFSEGQQRAFNTAMRFTKERGVRYRIGMRPYGFKTYGTLDNIDFVKVGRDYQEVELGFPFVGKGKETYIELVKEVANKRLSLVECFKGMTIDTFLGKSENLEEEAKSIVKERDKHITEYLKLINKERKAQKSSEIKKCDFTNLRDENPLYEMENLLLLLRGYDIKFVEKAFSDYKNKLPSKEREKYANDYEKKYKLSFLFILCTIYSSERKGYYGFKDYCLMSSGILGHFIDLCRRVFDIAHFNDPDSLLSGEQIPTTLQTEAAYTASQKEREMIVRIDECGKKLENFINNLGNVFSCIHKDKLIRYPETNIFPVSYSLSDINQKLLENACKWALIIKKPNMQDPNGNGKKGDIYFINRMFAPVFKISYRTRGGFNPVIVTDEYFKSDFSPESVLKSIKNADLNSESQLSLLDFENDATKEEDRK